MPAQGGVACSCHCGDVPNVVEKGHMQCRRLMWGKRMRTSVAVHGCEREVRSIRALSFFLDQVLWLMCVWLVCVCVCVFMCVCAHTRETWSRIWKPLLYININVWLTGCPSIAIRWRSGPTPTSWSHGTSRWTNPRSSPDGTLLREKGEGEHEGYSR